MRESNISFINLKFNVSEFHPFSNYPLFTVSLPYFPHNQPLPAAMHLMFVSDLKKYWKGLGTYKLPFTYAHGKLLHNKPK
jgi:hypothetical protein